MCVLTKREHLYNPSGLSQLFQPLVLQGTDLARHPLGEEVKWSPRSRSGAPVKKQRVKFALCLEEFMTYCSFCAQDENSCASDKVLRRYAQRWRGNGRSRAGGGSNLCRRYRCPDPAETLEPNVCLRIFLSQDKVAVI